MVQAIVNGKEADKTLSDYRDAQMPYLPKIQKDDRSKHIQKLVEEVGRGAMSISPVMQPRVKSKMKTKVVQRKEELVAQSNRISRKLGGIL